MPGYFFYPLFVVPIVAILAVPYVMNLVLPAKDVDEDN